MPDVIITYKNSTIADISNSGFIVLKTADKYCEEDIIATYNKIVGEEGIPIATKGVVENNSISITPSVTNIGGYIAGGTRAGSAVTVSANELVNGTKTISSSGTTDVTNYASVSVPAGSATITGTTVTVNPNISVSSNGVITAIVSNSQTITPIISEGYISTGTEGTILVNGSKTQQLPLYNGEVE